MDAEDSPVFSIAFFLIFSSIGQPAHLQSIFSFVDFLDTSHPGGDGDLPPSN